MTRLCWIGTLALALAACTSDDDAAGGNCGALVASCDKAASHVCFEYDDPTTASAAQQACADASGTFGTGACDRSAAVVGCLVAAQGAAGCSTTWFSAPLTRDQVAASCAALHGTLIDP